MNKNVLIISSSPRKGGNSETLLDRANPLYDTDYAFTKAYLLATAAENEPETGESRAGLGGLLPPL